MNKLLKLLFIFVIVILATSNISAQYDFVRTNSFTYPNELEFGGWKNLISLTLAKLPEDVVEEASAYIYSPLFNYDAIYGLPAGFSAHGNFSTNWISFHLSVEPKWSYRYKRFSFAVGYEVAYIYGRLYKFGFNSKIKGWLNTPNLTVGVAFNKFTMSFKAEAIFITSLEQFNDDIITSTDKNRSAGYSFGLTVEQPLWKNNFISLTLKGNYTRFYYPSWAAFPTWDRYNFIPEVIIGLVL